jgi:hypothetical protein
MDISKQGKVDLLQIAKQIDELASNPANMERWRQKIALTFERPEVVKIKDPTVVVIKPSKVIKEGTKEGTTPYKQWQASRDEVDVLLQKWLDDLDPKTDIDILYSLLAFYHDSRLPIRHIVDDGLKKQSPVFYEWMSLYYARGILIRPNMAIFPSQGEQCTVEQCLDVYLSHVKADLAGKKPEETEQKGKRGRHKKYTPEMREKMRNAYEELYEQSGDAKSAWYKVAKLYGIKTRDDSDYSGKAAEMACRRYLHKQNK